METPTTAQGTWLSAEEAGFLTAGPRRAAETVLARLIDTGLVRVSRDGLVSAVHQNGQGATTSVEARMLSHAQTPVRFDTIVQSIARSTEVADLYRHLFSRRLMQVPRRRGDGWWFSLAVAGMLTLAGFVSPAFFVGVPVALCFSFLQYGRSPVTKAGKEALKHVTAHDRVHAVALHGFTGKVGGQNVGELFDLPQSVVKMIPPKAHKAGKRSKADGGGCGAASSCSSCGTTSSGCGGCGGSSGSSCGGSSSCGGGGGGD
ncbi:TIGR04222 domain-containing membrane protein [Lentzea sp. BCCO 10_0798]|uniref:TIGR04222 domain-containing membrane protein n=1 Tax=Lentzea kristufekii TaxID=3095430 RepID=A0ABU4U2Y9_9PSEU|nr:TIGR04222 domain-containing membrane protein [Lentzea sp. BCCO 10_0798]MDX8054866.1 TIGR04222 domain-containing membrane protein [Lentzea sp. BCCO 10_0798]